MDTFKGFSCIFNNKILSFPIEKISINAEIVHTSVIVSSEFFYLPLKTADGYTEDKDDLPEECVFRFPLDETSAVFSFKAKIGENQNLIAEIMAKEEAQETYEKALASGHTAILLGQSQRSDDAFAMRLGLIPDDLRVTVSIEYIMTLEKFISESVANSESYILRLPTVLNPRYDPNPGSEDFATVHDGVSISKCNYKLEFGAKISSILEINSIESGNKDDNLLIEIKNNNASVKLSPTDSPKRVNDLSLIINYKTPSDCLNTLSVLYEKCDEKIDGKSNSSPFAYQLEFTPDLTSSGDDLIVQCFEFIFVIDRSGSMQGKNIENAKSSLLVLLKSLPDNCFFQILGFGSTFQTLFPTPVEYNEQNLATAISHQKSLDADLGGTEVLPALKEIYSKSIHKSAVGRKIFFLTDGDVGNVDEVVNLVRTNSNSTQLFAIGIGEGASSALVKGVARAGNGRAVFVGDGDKKLTGQLMNLLKSAMVPVLVDVKFNIEGFSSDGKNFFTVPDQKSMPNLVSGVTQHFYILSTDSFKLNNQEKIKISIAGNCGSLIKEICGFINLKNFPHSLRQDIIHRMAARKQIQYLTDNCDVGNDKQKEDIKKQVIAISKHYNLLSRFTSFVAVDLSSKQPIRRKKIETIPHFPVMMCAMSAPLRLRGGGAQVKSMHSPQVLYDLSDSSVCSMNFDECDSFSTAKAEPVDPINCLAEFLNIKGFWEVSSLNEIASIISLSVPQFTSLKPADLDSNCWLTMILISYLELKCQDRVDEWELFVGKTKKWLKQAVSDDKMLKTRELINKNWGMLFP